MGVRVQASKFVAASVAMRWVSSNARIWARMVSASRRARALASKRYPAAKPRAA